MAEDLGVLSFRDGWMSRGRELHAIYDALTAAVGHSPNGDPVEDIRRLGVEVERLRLKLTTIHVIAGRFMTRGPVAFTYEDISEALGLALQELSTIRRHADVTTNQFGLRGVEREDEEA